MHNKVRGALGGPSKILSGLYEKFKKLSKKRNKAFSLTEILIAMIIIAILGGAAIGALWLFFTSFSQIDDLTSAEFELNMAAQRLTRDFAMIGLGLPNNSGREPGAAEIGTGVTIGFPPEERIFNSSFAWSFRGADPQPVTASFGLEVGNPERGGPVTITTGPIANPVNIVGLTTPGGAGAPNRPLFIGSNLYYAFGVPTGVMAQINGNATIGRGANLIIEPVVNDAYNTLRNVSWDGRPAGVQSVADGVVDSANTRAWVLLPTLRIPMRVDTIDNPTGEMTVTVAPVDPPGLPAGAPDMNERLLMSLDEIHVMQAVRVFFDPASRELRRTVLATPNSADHEVLARNIVGLQFAFDPHSRVLMMFIAARGSERNPATGVGQHNWPDWLPPLAAEDLQFRIVTRTLTWGMRN